VRPTGWLMVLGSVPVLLAVAVGPGAWAGPGRAGGATEAAAAVPTRPALDGHLREILSRTDFRQATESGGIDPRVLARWLWLQVRRILSRLAGLHETNYALFLVAVIAGLAVLIPLLAHIVYTLARFFGSGRSLAREPAGPVATSRPLSPTDLIREAEHHAAEGRYREAVRSLYLAMNRDLQLRGLLPRTSSKTNWEYLSHLSSTPQILALARPFTQTFDEKWYGGRPTSAEEVNRCRRWLEAVRQEVEAA
jgi:hypothetical protein